MSKLLWDQTGEKLFESGVSQCALYKMSGTGYGTGVAWNGITAVNESPSGAEVTKLYANNGVYAGLVSAEEYAGTIEAYMYPDEFYECLGMKELATGVVVRQQARSNFGLVYRTEIGNDTDGMYHGYKLHIVYGATAAVSSEDHSTINDSPEAATFSWEFSTTPVAVTGEKPTANLVIDSTKVDANKLKTLEDTLYGTDSAEPKLLLPDEIKAIFAAG